jgi:hypothetical protein
MAKIMRAEVWRPGVQRMLAFASRVRSAAGATPPTDRASRPRARLALSQVVEAAMQPHRAGVGEVGPRRRRLQDSSAAGTRPRPQKKAIPPSWCCLAPALLKTTGSVGLRGALALPPPSVWSGAPPEADTRRGTIDGPPEGGSRRPGDERGGLLSTLQRRSSPRPILARSRRRAPLTSRCVSYFRSEAFVTPFREPMMLRAVVLALASVAGPSASVDVRLPARSPSTLRHLGNRDQSRSIVRKSGGETETSGWPLAIVT